MDVEEIYSPSKLLSTAIESIKNDPFFIILAGAIQIMITTTHWSCIALAISAYQTFLPEVINHPEIPNLLAEMLLVAGIIGTTSMGLLVVYIFDSLFRNIFLHYIQNSLLGNEISIELLSDTSSILKMLKWRGLKLLCILGTTFISLLPGFFIYSLRLLLDWESLSFIAMVLSLLFYIPSMGYLRVSLYKGDFYCAFDSKSPMDILKHSWKESSGQRISLFVFNLTRKTLIVVGALACYIPSFAIKGATLASEVSSFLEEQRNLGLRRSTTNPQSTSDDVHPFLQQAGAQNISPNTTVGQIMSGLGNTSKQHDRNIQSDRSPPPIPRAPKPPRR